MTDAAREYGATALVLRGREYGEGHRLFALLTREEGKVLAVARGITKPRAKLAAALQHFTLGEVTLARGRQHDVIIGMRVTNPFYGLRRSVEAFAYASYFSELFDASLEERQRHPALFDLLVEALERLAANDAPDLIARYVEINLIALLGYHPHLAQCAHCGAPLAPQGQWPTWLGFSAAAGGALCPDCLPGVPGARRIAAGTVQVAQRLLTKGYAGLEGVPLSDRLRREIAVTFRDYLEYRLERRLHSTRFLRDWGDADETALVADEN